MEKLSKLIEIFIPRNKKTLISTVTLKKARDYFVNEKKDEARRLIIKTLRENKWDLRILWIELIAMIEDKTDYELIRNSWSKAPLSISNDLVICNAVARAAAITGNKDDCRILLRHLITLTSQIQRFESKFEFDNLDKSPNRINLENSFSSKASVALHDLYKAFKDLPTPFLISGTLLGLVREGDFIGWDKDIDVGIFCTKEKVAEIETELRTNKLFVLRKLDLTTDRIRIKHISGASIDVFPHYPEENSNKIWHDGAATKWWNSPFTIKETKFLGEKSGYLVIQNYISMKIMVIGEFQLKYLMPD